ncbi:hypothetical protein TSUD_297090 [Trifolium subterraneum]|uniref:CCHC-type domain-containing protein n=1 Tax=Trifolium subterraneum TaxID=3900 RepID=A0A2Z6N818_TRISU|nr:hypothetical protein TSUD_297090 [Trifolium subterraneum]
MAESSDFAKPSIPKFDGFYDHWTMLMENLLRSKEYWSLIETGVVIALANVTAEQRNLANASKLTDLKVKNYLFQSIDRSILETILERNTAKDIWDAMRTKYQGSTRVKRAQLQALRKDFEVLAMGDSETIDEYFARTMAIANKMTSYGERVTQVTIVEKILRSLTAKFNFVVCSIKQSNDVTTLSIDELHSSLIVQEQRIKSQQISREEQALKAANLGRGSGINRGRGRSSSRGGRGRCRIAKEAIECFKCYKLGHYRSECPEWEENANFAEFLDEEETLLMASTNTDESKNGTWFLDSGCSNHMVGNKDWLYEFDESYRDSIKLGDDSKMNVMGKGNVKLSISGKIHVITGVFYIPGLKSNLLSIGQIQQKNVTIMFKNDICKIYHDEKEATTWSEAIQSSEAQSRSERLKVFRSSEEFRSSRMFRGLQEFRGCLLVMSHSEDEDVQKLNCEGLSEELVVPYNCTIGQTVKVKLLCKGRRDFTQRIFKDYSCPIYNGNFSNVSMSFSTHINMPKKELMTSALH